MTDTQTPSYPHRKNRDGSFDSICLRCFATIARAKEVAELKNREKQHVCDEAFLAERGLFSRTSAA